MGTYRSGNTRWRGRSDQSRVTMAPRSSSGSKSRNAARSAGPRTSGTSGSPGAKFTSTRRCINSRAGSRALERSGRQRPMPCGYPILAGKEVGKQLFDGSPGRHRLNDHADGHTHTADARFAAHYLRVHRDAVDLLQVVIITQAAAPGSCGILSEPIIGSKRVYQD
jgi:hypothetical protein